MALSEGFVAFVVDQMDGIGLVHHRRMFGGAGLYFEDLFFGVIADDRVYFKVDEGSRKRYEEAGSGPFRPYGEGRGSMSYCEVPPEVLEDRDEVKVWALEAIAVAGRKAGGEKPRGVSGRQRKRGAPTSSRKRSPG